MTTTVLLPDTGGPEGVEAEWFQEASEQDPSWSSPRRRGGHRLRRLVRGRRDDPAWVRPALLVLLATTAVLYLWDLGASGWANSFYSAAVQAGTKSWKAFFFGSSDSSNFITVDKPPASLWIMELSARIFGVNSWSILVPQALEGVATVAILYVTVRRWFGAKAGLIAGAVMALTPVAVLMFRFNNPDALLVLVLTLGAYCTTRAVEKASTRWLIGAFALVGLGFITKMMQAYLVVPGFGLAYLVAAPTNLGRRIRHLALGAVALVVSSGWWVAAVALTPAADRPYIGGSQNNSILNLIFGYNGFGRLTGHETGSVGGAGGGTSQWGPTGLTRLFNSEFGSQASWLLPTALILLGAGLAWSLRAARTDRTRAAMIIWGGWLIFTGLAFSLGQGIIHQYYTVALGPALGALVGIGAVLLWSHRHQLAARMVGAGAIAATGAWSYELLARMASWHPWLGPTALAAGLLAAGGILARPDLSRLFTPPRARLLTVAVAGAAAVAAFIGPAAYSLQTAGTVHTGSITTAGPAGASTGAGGGPGGAFGRPGGAFGRPGGGFGRPGGGFGRPAGAGGFPGRAGGFPGGTGGFPGGTGRFPGGTASRAGASTGGMLDGSTPSAALTKALEAGASKYKWVAATVGSNSASGYQLATGEAVMAIGGFNGTDPYPALAQFQARVAKGEVHYFIPGGGGLGGGGLGGGGGANQATNQYSSAITSWVESHYRSLTIGGTAVYDLTQPTSSASGS
jgi:4-amino-4-deoxy-L-arabinose transferase-like glycosyltransferase